MIPLIEQHHEQIAELCRHYDVERLDVFGSAATGEFTEQTSDLDFIVRFARPDEPGIARRYFRLADDLEQLFERPVDLITDGPFRNLYFVRSVQATRMPVYERRNEEVPV